MTIVEKQLAAEPKRGLYRMLVALLVVGALVWSATALEAPHQGTGGMTIARNILAGIFTPDTEILFDVQNGVPFLIIETLAIAFVGTLVGAVVSIPLAFLSAKNVVGQTVTFLVNLFIMAVRTIPVFVYGLMFIRVTGPGPFAGLLTMAIASVGMLSKLFAEAIEELDTGIIESLDAAGCNGFEKIRYGILPQLISDFLSIVIYRFDMNIRDVVVLGLVGAGGIGAPLIFAMRSNRWNEAGAILLGLIIVVFIVEYLSTKIRQKLARG